MYIFYWVVFIFVDKSGSLNDPDFGNFKASALGRRRCRTGLDSRHGELRSDLQGSPGGVSLRSASNFYEFPHAPFFPRQPSDYNQVNS